MDLDPPLVGVCAGYEQGLWRGEQLASHLMRWLPEFALRDSERSTLNAANAMERIALAARTVYTSPKYAKRGEVGELLLHAVLRQVFGTLPAIAKLFFKDAPNDTVKGFDAVHVVATTSELELWLGEVKLYTNINAAIRDVVNELKKHTDADYLRGEFAAITNKIDSSWPHADRLKKLLDPATSLDDIFARVSVPVLLTYNSTVLATHTAVSAAFRSAIAAEFESHHSTFAGQPRPASVRVHLILLPMNRKADLVTAFDARLKSAQSMI